MTHFLICSVAAVLAAAYSAIARNTRDTLIATWCVGAAVGGLFLTLGAEFLAITVWLLATGGATVTHFYAITLGEQQGLGSADAKRRPIDFLLPTLSGAALVVAFCVGVGPARAIEVPESTHGFGVAEVGKFALEHYFLSLELLAILALFALIGAGLISRPEQGD